MSAVLRQPPKNEGDYNEYLHPKNKDKVEAYTIGEFKGLVKENLDVGMYNSSLHLTASLTNDSANAIGFPSTPDCLPPTMADDLIGMMRGVFANVRFLPCWRL